MVAKSSKKDASPTRKAGAKEASTSRALRSSPGRTEKPKSPRKAPAKTPPASPSRRSPARKSPSRRSPIRKSPTRRSPARKSPARRSPGRSAKDAKSSEAEKKRASGSKTRKEVVDVDSDSDVDLVSRRLNAEKPKAAVRGRARKLDSEYMLPKDINAAKEGTSVNRDISSYMGLVRRSVPKSQSREIDRIVHLRSNDSPIQKLTEFSDEDEVPATRSSFVKEKSERHSEPKAVEERTHKTEFGGWIGALLLIFAAPLFTISLFVLCNEYQCSFKKLPNLQKYKYFATFVDSTALIIYSGFVGLVAVLSALPFAGWKVSGLPNKQGKLNYVMNGLFIALVTSVVLVGLEFYNVPVISNILKRYFQVLMSSLILGCSLSVYLYARSFFVPISALNPYAISNSRIYNFWAGRELNPRILGHIDVKLVLYRIGLIGVILLNAIFVYKSIEYTSSAEVSSSFNLKSLKFNPTLLVIATMQSIHALDSLVFESAFVTTFGAQYEGVGYMSSVYFLPSPFLLTMVSKYVYDFGIQLPAWQLGVAVFLFVIGYVSSRASNSQKNAFRKNPYNPALSNLESMPTSQGKKLLVSGYWGVVRHPNYLGDILVMLSFALFALDVPPALICLSNVLLLLYRAHRDGVRCRQRYGAAWDRYCQRVKYVLVPKVF